MITRRNKNKINKKNIKKKRRFTFKYKLVGGAEKEDIMSWTAYITLLIEAINKQFPDNPSKDKLTSITSLYETEYKSITTNKSENQDRLVLYLKAAENVLNTILTAEFIKKNKVSINEIIIKEKQNPYLIAKIQANKPLTEKEAQLFVKIEQEDENDEDEDDNVIKLHQAGGSDGNPLPDLTTTINLYNRQWKDNSTHDKEIIKIKKYIIELFKYTNEYCFDKGAFVIEDNNKELFNLLFRNKDLVGSDPNMLDSIDVINPKDKLFTIPLSYESHNKYLNEKARDMYEIHLVEDNTKIIHQCGNCGGELTFTNVKWYPFEQKEKNYVYIKLEGYPTISWAHLKHWIIRHYYSKNKVKRARIGAAKLILWVKAREMYDSLLAHFSKRDEIKDGKKSKPPNESTEETEETEAGGGNRDETAINVCKTRREDCKSGKKIKKGEQPCRYNDAKASIPFENFESYVIEDGKPRKIIENYERKGDEFFVPTEVSEFILNNIDKSIIYTVDANNVVTISTDVTVASNSSNI
jgi:hypothetical protein